MASRKKQNNTRKRDGIHFVNARPTSETERLKAQKLVRAHVGRWISDQTKDRSAASEQSSSISAPRSSRSSINASTGTGTDNAGPSSFPLVSRQPPYVAQRTLTIAASTPHPPQRDWQQRSSVTASQVSDSSDSSGSDDAAEVTNFGDPVSVVPWNEVTRVEPLISGFLDPFAQHPSNFAPEIVNMCESYCAYSPNIPIIPMSKLGEVRNIASM